MEITKRIILVIVTLAVTLLQGCSSRPQLIEEEELKVIIREMMITDAIINTRGETAKFDTLDTYATILKRHGYERRDFTYTIGEMAGRKSNPLNNIFEQIKIELTGESTTADANYAKLRSYDSLARVVSADTIYRSDRALKPPFAGHKIRIDTVLRAGDYTLSFDYRTHGSYDLGVRTVTVKAVNADTTKNIRGVALMNRTSIFLPLRQAIRVPGEGAFTRLEVAFSDPRAEKGFRGADTTLVRNVRIVYDPPLTEARNLLFEKATGVKMSSDPDKNSDNYDKLWNLQRPEDLRAVDTTAGRATGAQRPGDVRR